MKISKRVREEAAFICALCASGQWFATYVQDVAEWRDRPVQRRASRLAWEAITFVESTASHHPARNGWDRGNCAEAESLLRTGWNPVPRRNTPESTKLTAPQSKLLRHIERSLREYDGFAPHTAGDWRVMQSLIRLKLADFVSMGECGDGCERAGDCPHPVQIYTLSEAARRRLNGDS